MSVVSEESNLVDAIKSHSWMTSGVKLAFWSSCLRWMTPVVCAFAHWPILSCGFWATTETEDINCISWSRYQIGQLCGQTLRLPLLTIKLDQYQMQPHLTELIMIINDIKALYIKASLKYRLHPRCRIWAHLRHLDIRKWMSSTWTIQQLVHITITAHLLSHPAWKAPDWPTLLESMNLPHLFRDPLPHNCLPPLFPPREGHTVSAEKSLAVTLVARGK